MNNDNLDNLVCQAIGSWLAGYTTAVIKPDTSTESMSIDSLDHVEIIMTLEDEFDIEIPDFDKPATMQGYIDAVRRQRKP